MSKGEMMKLASRGRPVRPSPAGPDSELASRLRARTWPVQGQSTAPDNLLDWLLADNRYPQHRGRAAALELIGEMASEIAALRALAAIQEVRHA